MNMIIRHKTTGAVLFTGDTADNLDDTNHDTEQTEPKDQSCANNDSAGGRMPQDDNTGDDTQNTQQ